MRMKSSCSDTPVFGKYAGVTEPSSLGNQVGWNLPTALMDGADDPKDFISSFS